MAPVFTIENLRVGYETRAGLLRAVDGVSLQIERGEILALVGESGSGKSTLGKALMRMIVPPGQQAADRLEFDGIDLLELPDPEMRKLRGAKIGMIFQDPMTSLVPVDRIISQLEVTIRAHEGGKVSAAEIRARANELARRLGIRPERLDDYPHQLSGGMRQRVMIALTLVLHCSFVIADEPTTSLDVIVEAQFLDLLRELRDELGLTIVLITHNIGIVAEVADRVAVMYAGRIVEIGPVEEIFASPAHPYTQGLLKSVPTIDLESLELYKMEGLPPNLLAPTEGCPFRPRCEHAMSACTNDPPLHRVSERQAAACWLHGTGSNGSTRGAT